MFISYRVDTDAAFATAIHTAAHTRLGYNVFLDRLDIAPAADWRQSFVGALGRARVVVAVVSWVAESEGEGARVRGSAGQMAGLTADAGVDNVLLEWEIALELKAQGSVEHIQPVVVGAFPVAAMLPDVVCEATKAEARRWLGELGVGAHLLSR